MTLEARDWKKIQKSLEQPEREVVLLFSGKSVEKLCGVQYGQ